MITQDELDRLQEYLAAGEEDCRTDLDADAVALAAKLLDGYKALRWLCWDVVADLEGWRPRLEGVLPGVGDAVAASTRQISALVGRSPAFPAPLPAPLPPPTQDINPVDVGRVELPTF
ncbi:MAG: hypothetical protein ACRC33_22610 [Gemmataceae bacterium]